MGDRKTIKSSHYHITSDTLQIPFVVVPVIILFSRAKMAATPTSKEHEVGKEFNVPLDGVLKQIVDSIQSVGDRLENKIERLQTDMDLLSPRNKRELGWSESYHQQHCKVSGASLGAY